MRGRAYATLNYDEYNFFFIIKKGFFLSHRKVYYMVASEYLSQEFAYKDIRIANNI